MSGKTEEMTFNDFYVHWYSRMKSFAREYVVSDDDAEDIVQDIFLELIDVYSILNNRVNIVAYIFTSTRNRCIDHLRRKLIAQESADRMQEEYQLTLQMKFDSLEAMDEQLLQDGEIEQMIEKALQTLPERCRQIFILHKMEGKKQKEIARALDISVKTVENQVAIAYRKLREQLKDYSPLLFFLLHL